MSTPPPPPPLSPPCSPLHELPNDDPPPPYPARDRRPRRARRPSQRISESDADALSAHAPYPEDPPHSTASETTPLLSPRLRAARPRAYSHTSARSATSVAPSLAQTVFSLFHSDDDDEEDTDEERLPLAEDPGHSSDEARRALDVRHADSRRASGGFWTVRAWRRYFRPLAQRSAYAAFFHLAILNMPYALVAWVYLFVFTLTGTALLIALPLGALLCFLDLLGARAFARGELALQARFHGPLAVVPYPSRPIFARMRHSDVESGAPVPDRSFYRKTYAMFTDPTSYQALFYFLVIKPGIALFLALLAIVLVPAAFVLVLPAPAILRAARRLGAWQANIAIEGLYVAVR